VLLTGRGIVFASQNAGDRTRLQYCGSPAFELVGSRCPPGICIQFVLVRSPITNKKRRPEPPLFIGAGDRTRTGTLSPAADFESCDGFGNLRNHGERYGILWNPKMPSYQQLFLFSSRKQVQSTSF